MQAFVIKNKDGKYFCGFDGLAGINIFSERVIDGLNTQTPTLEHCMEEIEDYHLSDCEIVKVTIAEGDLEQQLIAKNKEIAHLEECNESLSNKFDKESDIQNKIDILKYNIDGLEQQLVEKDKEIDKLSKENLELFGYIKDYRNLWLAEQRKNKEIRKQVCDEIRELLRKQKTQADDGIHTYLQDMCYWQDIDAILDKVERGE